MLKIKPENRFWIGIYGFTAFVMLVAVSVFAWLAWTSKEEPGVGRVAGSHPLPGANNTLPEESYELLAAFDAPAYMPERLSKDVPKDFPAAMAQYTNHNYSAAAAALRKIADAKPDFTPSRFYLGISLLLSNNRIAGIQELVTSPAPLTILTSNARAFIWPRRSLASTTSLGPSSS